MGHHHQLMGELRLDNQESFYNFRDSCCSTWASSGWPSEELELGDLWVLELVAAFPRPVLLARFFGGTLDFRRGEAATVILRLALLEASNGNEEWEERAGFL